MTPILSPEQELQELIKGTVHVHNKEELLLKLKKRTPLRIKLGVDPTSSDLHLGHTVVLQKLRQFQQFGHHAVLIIGDYTALIGDPTGRSTTRPHLNLEEILKHAATYQQQALKILDPQKTEIRFNSEWLSPIKLAELISLCGRITVQQFLQREDFKNRIEKNIPLHLHELLYPLMQGWDSVMIDADVELGGTDQLFNLLVGRDLQKIEGKSQQIVMTLPLLVGLDGVQKMSKSFGNYVGVTEESDTMFGKLMSISDKLMKEYYLLLLGETLSEEEHAMEAKKRLASTLVAQYHGKEKADDARSYFEKRFSQKNLEEIELPSYSLSDLEDKGIVPAAVFLFQKVFGVTKSRSELRRLVEGGGLSFNGSKIEDPSFELSLETPGILKLDRKHALRLTL